MIRLPDNQMRPVKLYRGLSRKEGCPVRALACRSSWQRQVRYIMGARMSRGARREWMREIADMRGRL